MQFYLPEVTMYLRLNSLFFILIIGLFGVSCSEMRKEGKEESASGKLVFREVPTWLGSYQDTMPCPDCKGVLTRIDLKSDSTYKKSEVQLGKEPIFDYTSSIQGRWEFKSQEKLLILDSAKNGQKQVFEVVGDSILKLCDQNLRAEKSPRYWLARVL